MRKTIIKLVSMIRLNFLSIYSIIESSPTKNISYPFMMILSLSIEQRIRLRVSVFDRSLTQSLFLLIQKDAPPRLNINFDRDGTITIDSTFKTITYTDIKLAERPHLKDVYTFLRILGKYSNTNNVILFVAQQQVIYFI